MNRFNDPVASATEKLRDKARFFETLSWPDSQARIASLMQRGLQQNGEFELRLGQHLAA
jgi:hypothetical protein